MEINENQRESMNVIGYQRTSVRISENKCAQTLAQPAWQPLIDECRPQVYCLCDNGRMHFQSSALVGT